MITKICSYGDLMRVHSRDFGKASPFTDQDTKAVINPTVATFYVKSPNGTKTAYKYGTDPEVERPATGQFYIDINTTQSGNWLVELAGTGNGQATETIKLVVRPPLARDEV